jgi:hypothetical protein
LAAIALGEETVMTDAMEAVGQNVQQEAADELMSGEARDLSVAVATIIFIGEGDLVVGHGDEP